MYHKMELFAQEREEHYVIKKMALKHSFSLQEANQAYQTLALVLATNDGNQ